MTESGVKVANRGDDGDDIVGAEDVEPSTPDAAETSKPDDAVDSGSTGEVSPKRDDQDDQEASTKRKPSPRRVSLSVRTLVVATVFVVLLAALAAMVWLYFGERAKVEAQLRQTDNDRHAEQIALDYAVNAATMNFQDLNTWKGKLVNGTTPNLRDKLTKAATSMEQLLVPLEWTSTAQPLVAKVRSDTNGVYVVDTFVSVLTKTTQAPDRLQSTATYSITINSKDNWQISDVGGIGAVAGAK
jgi:Mce-associated membrane protein